MTDNPGYPIFEPPAWQDLGACKGSDPGLFFPGRGDMVGLRAAQAVCRECPVRQECLDWALANNEVHGVWGGCSERERRKIKRRTVPKCGTNGGYRRHVALGEVPCDPCVTARDAYWEARSARNPTRSEAGVRKARNLQSHRDQGWCLACARSDHANCMTDCGISCSCPRCQPEEVAS